MRFTLYYDGPLLSSASDARIREKQRIRESLYPQLLELWRTHPALPKPHGRDWSGWSKWDWPELMAPWWRNKSIYPRRGIRFVPLVRQDISTICELSVIFLRPGYPGSIFKGGDIDNRIKTLSDGLCVPQEAQLNDVQVNHPLEDPFFCLLEDDSLISSWSIRTAQLLSSLPDDRKDYVRLIIDVDIKITKLDADNIALTGN